MKIPVNRIVAACGPLWAVAAGGIATWIMTRLHFLSDFHAVDDVSNWIEQVIVFGVTSVLVWLGAHDWLKGWIVHEATQASSQADAIVETRKDT